jgi:two-component system nitrogen regulation response regulator GlnG
LDVVLKSVDGIDRAARIIAANAPDLVVCDFVAFEEVRKRWPRLCAIVVAESRDGEQAIESIKRGALDYLLKPLRQETLLRRISEALRISRDIHVPAVYDEPSENQRVARIVGQSPTMQEVYRLIGLVAMRDVNVLITGESGTGKELVARAIYHHSRRRDKPFLAVNCAAIPETLLESELFGHEKGAFTGADLRRVGKFEQCHRGTLFLDEIGDLPLATQAKLLRVLQDGTFQRVGGTETITCDVRILAASNQALERLIAERRFRHDLYYRLKVASIFVPPLRRREVDVVLLAHHFVKQFNPQFGTRLRSFSPEVLSTLLGYSWPGNVRELENVIKASLVVARGTEFRREFLPEHIQKMAKHQSAETEAPAADLAPRAVRRMAMDLVADERCRGSVHARGMAAVERELIRAALDQTAGRIAPAARLLGISRTTLRQKIREYGVQVSTAIEFEGDQQDDTVRP